MALLHLLYTFSLICGIVGSALYFTRHHWTPYLPAHLRAHLSHYVPLPQLAPDAATSFSEDVEAGFTSSQFDLSRNVEDGDDRHGLDAVSRAEVKRIMKVKKCTFDQARLIYLQDKMRKAGIDPMTGLPIDSKFVSFSPR